MSSLIIGSVIPITGIGQNLNIKYKWSATNETSMYQSMELVRRIVI